jgi:hypothetical protein
MNCSVLARTAVFAAVIGCLSLVPARAQEPSADAVAAAKELIATKGGGLFDPLIPGVVESVKNSFVPTNPQLIRELNEVSAQLRKEYDAKRPELLNEVAHIYARHFTEQELKDMVAFYRTPLGKKMIIQEPRALDDSLRRAQDWANQLSEEVMGRFRAEMKKKGHNL